MEDDFCSCDVSKEEVYKYLDEKATAYRNKFTTDQIRKHNETKIYPKYGFRYKKGKMELEIDPEVAGHIRRVFKLICEGHSCSETAKILTAEGIESSGNYDFDSSREEDRNSMVVPIKNMINEMYAKDASKKRVLSFEMHVERQ